MSTRQKSNIPVMIILFSSLLLITTMSCRKSAELTDAERFQLLQDRFLKGEISEKAYYDLKAQLEKKSGKPRAEAQKRDIKPVQKQTEKKSDKTAAEARKSGVKQVQAVERVSIKNGGFEQDKDGDGMPDGWEKWGTRVTYLMDDEEKHSGDYSGKLTSVRKVGNEGWKQTVIVQPGKKYEFTVWAKGGRDLQYFQGDSGPVVSFSGGGGFIEKGKALKTAPTWLKLSKVVEGPKEGKMTISMYFYHCSGTAWFDDAVLKPVE